MFFDGSLSDELDQWEGEAPFQIGHTKERNLLLNSAHSYKHAPDDLGYFSIATSEILYGFSTYR